MSARLGSALPSVIIRDFAALASRRQSRGPVCADVAELVDALDLGSSIERCGSSSLPIRTILFFLYNAVLPI